MPRKERNQVEDILYVDDDTGAVIETMKYRVFYSLDAQRERWDEYRRYALDREHLVNPGFREQP